MGGVRIPQDLNGEDHLLLGLSVPRLAALLLGLLAAYTILHLDLPAPIGIGAAALVALAGAIMTWVRPAGRSLAHWAIAAIEFKLDERLGGRDQPTRTAPDSAHETNQPTPKTTPRLQVLALHRASERPTAVAETTLFLDEDPLELPDSVDLSLPGDSAQSEDEVAVSAPVYLGGPQIIVFFSAKGGVGRTTLATEVAALLATRGRYRDSATTAPERLRVALIDFDLGSANVSTRLGLAQPTMLDYACDTGGQTANPIDFAIHHPATNVDVLLGPAKCLTGDRADLIGVAQAAHILSCFKGAGYQFIILDIAAAIGDLETYLLEAATRIYCVVTPTAGSVQSLYRGVEALRRLGLGTKLQYVANKMRDGISLAEPMGDLNGSLVARVPYDAAFDTAENQHRPLVLQGNAQAQAHIMQLAASIYPALGLPLVGRSTGFPFAWFGKRRRAG